MVFGLLNVTSFVLADDSLIRAKGDYWEINLRTPINTERYVKFEVYKQMPAKGTSYGDSAAAMNDNYGIDPTTPLPGGTVVYSINYTVNGVTKYDTYMWTVF